MCLPGLSRPWPCSISIHLSPRSVTAGVRPCSNSIHLSPSRCWCPPFSVGHVAFLFICLRDVSLLVSALFRWRCNISIHSPSSLPLRRVSQFFLKMCPPIFLLAMQHFNSFVFKMISLLLSPRFGACTAGVRPFPLAMQHFY